MDPQISQISQMGKKLVFINAKSIALSFFSA